MKTKSLSFWDHIDELRSLLFKTGIVLLLCVLILFFFKEILFSIVLAPKYESFITYKIIDSLINFLNIYTNKDPFSIQLINTGLAEQLMIHIKVSMYCGILCSSPYILYTLFKFVSPGLYKNEKKIALNIVFGGYLMFLLGVLLSYFLIFPLTFRFLGTYQISNEVINLISLNSYIDTLMVLCLIMGIFFEVPLLSWTLAKLGFISNSLMRKYRRHTIIALLLISAVLTPTTDLFTLLLVALPIYVLYEFSILIVSHTKQITSTQL